MRKQVVVVFFDETANTFRYREVNSAGTHIHGDQEGAVVGDIYISNAIRGPLASSHKEKQTVSICSCTDLTRPPHATHQV
jgi:hypothetical protein